MHRRIESILVLWMMVGAGCGAVVGFLYMAWVSLMSRSVAGSGGWTLLFVVVGAAIGVAVALPVGVSWIVMARPERDALVGARWGVGLIAFSTVFAISLVLFQGVGGLALGCAAVAGLGAYFSGPRLGVWRSAP